MTRRDPGRTAPPKESDGLLGPTALDGCYQTRSAGVFRCELFVTGTRARHCIRAQEGGGATGFTTTLGTCVVSGGQVRVSLEPAACPPLASGAGGSLHRYEQRPWIEMRLTAAYDRDSGRVSRLSTEDGTVYFRI